MSHPSAIPLPPASGDDHVDGDRAADTDPTVGFDDDRPLDPDLDDNQIDSADADMRAATEGVIGEDESSSTAPRLESDAATR